MTSEKPEAARTNRLVNETSPYLQQHARNPVDWYPWGEEALERARREDKPIFLSVGYAACHWCHVMEHECFENPEIAASMNEHFVNIKVDREERPDLDDIYMSAVQLLTGQGGWPMSVFLTPDLKPFFGGTYFPPQDVHGRPGFPRILEAMRDAYRERREQVAEQANLLTERISLLASTAGSEEDPGPELLARAVADLEETFDSTHGGFGSAPKFPHSMGVQLLLRAHLRQAAGSDVPVNDPIPVGDADSTRPLEMAVVTLTQMAEGGIYDHLGGGFHRYSTDSRWLVPHFEKMLYDQALLVLAYADGYQVTGAPLFESVIRETLHYVQREMTDPEGGFYASEDADSEGVEGKYYVWTLDEVRAVLGDRTEVFARVYDVDAMGNFEGKSILHRSGFEEVARRAGRAPEDLEAELDASRLALHQARSKRVRPGRDEKILTAWNALMISAFARAARVLGDDSFGDSALRAGEFLWGTLRKDGALHRVHKDGRTRVPGFLEDHANFIQACADLHELTFDPLWLERGLELADQMVDLFGDPSGGFYQSNDRHEGLIVRVKLGHDGSVPAGNSMAALALLRLARLTDRRDLATRAVETLRAFRPYLERSPGGFHQMLLALDFHLGPAREVVVVGPPESEATTELRRVVETTFAPWTVVTGTAAGDARSAMEGAAETEALPNQALLEGKDLIEGGPAVYVCRDYACEAPATNAATVKLRLD